MSKTWEQTATRALEHLGILSIGEVAEPAEISFATDTLEGIAYELNETHGIDIGISGREIHAAYYLPLAKLLAVDLAPRYEVPPRDTRASCIMAIRAMSYPDDRADRRDIDGNGTVTSDETLASEHAAYY